MDIAFERDRIFSEIEKVAKNSGVYDLKEKNRILQCTFKKFSRPLQLFDWIENSCFLDSVVAVLLYCKFPFWRNSIYNASVDDDIVKGFLSVKKTCKPLRQKLMKKDKNMSEKGFYEAVTTFELLAEHFDMKIPDWKEYVVYSSDNLGRARPPFFVYSPLGLDSKNKMIYVKKPEHKDYVLVGAIKNLGFSHYVSFFESHDGIYYYDDLRDPIKVKKIPDSNYELEFYVHKSLY